MAQIENRPLTEQVEENILSYIRQKELQVGERIPNEFELARQFGVGRGTIREAIRSLVSQNVLEVRRGAGTFIRSTYPMVDDPLGISGIGDRSRLVLDLLEVRLMLEPEIAALAAENADAEDIRQLREACRRVEQDIDQNVDHTEHDIQFHTCVARCSKNLVVGNLIPIINSSVAMLVDFTQSQLKEETRTTHRNILESIARGDRIGARCAMMAHLSENRRKILEMREKSYGHFDQK